MDNGLESYKVWWQERIKKISPTGRVILPDFFEVWSARQPEIEQLKQENAELKNKIKLLEAEKFRG
jgi:cell division protein FtsB